MDWEAVDAVDAVEGEKVKEVDSVKAEEVEEVGAVRRGYEGCGNEECGCGGYRILPDPDWHHESCMLLYHDLWWHHSHLNIFSTCD